jgi:hypothetical protein
MFFLREVSPPLFAGDKETMDSKIYEFDVKKEDYMLKQFVDWDYITTDIYTLHTDDNRVFYVPSGHYVYVGSEDGIVDWILIDELIDRDVEVFVIHNQFKDWFLKRLYLDNVYATSYYYPVTKNPVPFTDMKGEWMIINSSIDQYHKLKNTRPNIFFMES